MEKEYIDRLFDKELEFYLKTVGAVQIVGPKYCGKSRTAKRHAKTIIDLMKNKRRLSIDYFEKKMKKLQIEIERKSCILD